MSSNNNSDTYDFFYHFAHMSDPICKDLLSELTKYDEFDLKPVKINRPKLKPLKFVLIKNEISDSSS